MKRDESIERTITGVIFPATRDKDGKVLSVLIDSADDDQDRYLVQNNKEGIEFIELIHRQIEMTGNISENNNGDFIIDVKSYRTFENNKTNGNQGA